MTIKEANNFYDEDKMLYDLNSNKEFINLFKELTNNGKNSYYDISDLQNLIDKLKIWYEFKYPEKIYNKREYFGLENISDIANEINYKQLLYSLDETSYCILNCFYRNGSYSGREVIDKNGNRKVISLLFIPCTKNNRKVLIYVNQINGIVYEAKLDGINVKYEDQISLDQLSQMIEGADLSEIKETLQIYQADFRIRKEVLRLAALEILYSDQSIPEYGYERAKKFIEEMNEAIPDLNLSTIEINEIISRDYFYDKKSFTSYKDLNSEEVKTKIQSSKKRLVNIFKKNK